MKWTKIPAPDHLKNYVRSFWTLESDGTSSEQRSFRTLADGCPGLIFQHPDEGRFHLDRQPLPALLLYGQSTRPAELSFSGRSTITGIYFQPHALRSIFGLKAEELTDTCMDLAERKNTPEHFLVEQLSASRSVAGQVRLLDSYLFARITHQDRHTDPMMDHALAQIIHTKGGLSLKTLRNTLQLSERSFERKFLEMTGIPPKLFCRICRFQASLTQLRNKDFRKLSDIAFENDYADQSHLIRSFKEFAGISPFQYQKQYQEVIENFSERLG